MFADPEFDAWLTVQLIAQTNLSQRFEGLIEDLTEIDGALAAF